LRMLPNAAPFWQHRHQAVAAVAPIVPTSGCAVGSRKLTLWMIPKHAEAAARDRDNCFVADTARR
jgi:hypothetical protein